MTDNDPCPSLSLSCRVLFFPILILPDPSPSLSSSFPILIPSVAVTDTDGRLA